MTCVLRHMLRIVCLVALATYGMAAAATGPGLHGLSELVICSEGGTQTVWLNADGEPVQPDEPCCNCLDCLDLPAFSAVSPGQTARRARRGADRHPVPRQRLVRHPRPDLPQARGPPFASPETGMPLWSVCRIKGLTVVKVMAPLLRHSVGRCRKEAR